MKEKLINFIWQHTGWIPPDWSRRDYERKLYYWNALVRIERGEQFPRAIAWEALHGGWEGD